MTGYYFDDRGEQWDDRSLALRRNLLAPQLEARFHDYVIRNVGFAHVETGAERARVSLRPAIVAQPAVAALLYWLCDASPRRVAIHAWDGEHFDCIGRIAAMERIRQLTDVSINDRGDDFRRRRVAIDDLPAVSPLGALIRTWTGGAAASSLADHLLGPLAGKYSVVDSDLRIRDVGPGIVMYGEPWRQIAPSQKFEDQPDVAYARWISAAYREVARTRTPLLEEIDAVVQDPLRGRRRIGYRRVVLPYLDGQLLGATHLDHSIDLLDARPALGD